MKKSIFGEKNDFVFMQTKNVRPLHIKFSSFFMKHSQKPDKIFVKRLNDLHKNNPLDHTT